MGTTADTALGIYLKDCRARLDPKAFGFSSPRRRTPGLRREEVAQRAHVSATWYTWLEQGRGGIPSADVLDRVARALALKPVEREYLFLLAQHRPPEVRYQSAEITPQLQRVLDSLELSPALVKTSTWDIVAWNRAATAVLCDYDALAPRQRNILRLLFTDAEVRSVMPNWESDARFVIAAARGDAARAGASKQMEDLVTELSELSSEFKAMWQENDVRGFDEGTKQIDRPGVGRIAMDYSAFAVEGQSDLGMVIYTPATAADAARMRKLIRSRKSRPGRSRDGSRPIAGASLQRA